MEKAKNILKFLYDLALGLIQGNPAAAFWAWLISLAVVGIVF